MKDKNSLGYDVVRSIVVTLVILIIFYISKFSLMSFNCNSFHSTFLGMFVSLLGFILTAITILIMFDSDKNKNLKKLKDVGYFTQILERFISTTFVIFFGVIIFTVLTLTSVYQTGGWTNYLMNSIVLLVFILMLLRIYRSLNILHLIYKLSYKK